MDHPLDLYSPMSERRVKERSYLARHSEARHNEASAHADGREGASPRAPQRDRRSGGAAFEGRRGVRRKRLWHRLWHLSRALVGENGAYGGVW
jgi:hypothetical protein